MGDKDIHSTGRGGVGNIGQGEGQYADAATFDGKPGKPTVDNPNSLGKKGGVVHDSRTGAAVGSGSVPAPVGEYISKPAGEEAQSVYPEYHTGRGGEGNVHKQNAYVDEPVTDKNDTQTPYHDFHTGRGGEGNVHKDKYDGHSKPVKGKEEGHGHEGGLVGKVKHAVGLEKK